MDISVIIPTCDRPEQLAQCLDRLAPGVQTLGSTYYEIVVSDDGRKFPAQATLAARFPHVRWIEGPRRGPASNRNCAAAASEGKLLVFTDDDCLPDAGWLEALHKEAGKHPDAVLEGKTYAERPRVTMAEESPLNETGGNLWSCNFAIRADQFSSLGGFDEAFPYPAFEDIDLQVRIKRHAWEIIFVERASVCHPWRLAPGWRRLQQNRRALLVFMDKHPDAKHFRSLRFWGGSIFWAFVRDIPAVLWNYRGAGLWYVLEQLGIKFMMFWTVLTASPPYARTSRPNL